MNDELDSSIKKAVPVVEQVSDTIPVIYLIGDKVVNIKHGSEYNDKGDVVYDEEDGNGVIDLDILGLD